MYRRFCDLVPCTRSRRCAATWPELEFSMLAPAIAAAASRFDKNKKPASQIQRSSVGTQVPTKRRQKRSSWSGQPLTSSPCPPSKSQGGIRPRLQHFTQDPLLGRTLRKTKGSDGSVYWLGFSEEPIRPWSNSWRSKQGTHRFLEEDDAHRLSETEFVHVHDESSSLGWPSHTASLTQPKGRTRRTTWQQGSASRARETP